MSVKISNDTANGSVTLKGQNVAGDRTITMPNLDCELAPRMQLMTAQNSTSGTSIDFTGIPSWAKRITVMLYGVSTNGLSKVQVQLGTSTAIQNTGYGSVSVVTVTSASSTSGVLTTGMDTGLASSGQVASGAMTLLNVDGNSWISTSLLSDKATAYTYQASGNVTLSGTLDRIRITTVNGTDIFDAGTINILVEG